MGTSLKVHPFASLVDKVAADTPRLLVNREVVGVHTKEERAILRMLERSEGFVFDDDERWRDVAVLGDCDDGVKALAAALGWSDEFEAIIAAGKVEFGAKATIAAGNGKGGVTAQGGGEGGEGTAVTDLAEAIDGVSLN